jgi:hypothetical protein
MYDHACLAAPEAGEETVAERGWAAAQAEENEKPLHTAVSWQWRAVSATHHYAAARFFFHIDRRNTSISALTLRNR